MKHFNLSLVIIVVTGFSLSACATNTEHLSPTYGKAYAATMDKQIVSTTVVTGAPVMPGDKAGDAVRRYLDDEIKEPKEASEIVTETE